MIRHTRHASYDLSPSSYGMQDSGSGHLSHFPPSQFASLTPPEPVRHHQASDCGSAFPQQQRQPVLHGHIQYPISQYGGQLPYEASRLPQQQQQQAFTTPYHHRHVFADGDSLNSELVQSHLYSVSQPHLRQIYTSPLPPPPHSGRQHQHHGPPPLHRVAGLPMHHSNSVPSHPLSPTAVKPGQDYHQQLADSTMESDESVSDSETGNVGVNWTREEQICTTLSIPISLCGFTAGTLCSVFRVLFALLVI
ncbi:hypothetical protein EDD21DRAFT_150133 [Dissophora ornata]|nr:hypothetical protein EDD21DRAFT_150133 [Dissophora ornata]